MTYSLKVCCEGAHWNYYITQECSACHSSRSVNAPADFLREMWEGWNELERQKKEEECGGEPT